MTAPSPMSNLNLEMEDLRGTVLGQLQALQERIYQRDQTVATELLSIKNKVSAMEAEIAEMKLDITKIKTQLGLSSIEGRARKWDIAPTRESIVDEVFKNNM